MFNNFTQLALMDIINSSGRNGRRANSPHLPKPKTQAPALTSSPKVGRKRHQTGVMVGENGIVEFCWTEACTWEGEGVLSLAFDQGSMGPGSCECA